MSDCCSTYSVASPSQLTLPSVNAAASSSALLALSNLRNCFNFNRLHVPSAVEVSLARSSRFSSFLSFALSKAYPAAVSVRIKSVMMVERYAALDAAGDVPSVCSG